MYDCPPEMDWSSNDSVKMRAIRAIIRCEVVLDALSLEPGCVVHVSHLAFEGTGGPRFPATMETNPELLMWLSPPDLLPGWEFLHRQPFSQYWALALRPRRGRNERGRFLSDPWKEGFGTEPFRFESLGALMQYMRRSTL